MGVCKRDYYLVSSCKHHLKVWLSGLDCFSSSPDAYDFVSFLDRGRDIYGI